MARKVMTKYTATASLSLDWSDNRGICSHVITGDYDRCAQQVDQWIAEMRSAGAESAIRTVTLRRDDDWDRATLRHLGLPMIEVSYFDDEQGLTLAEAYTARVHDWHVMADRHNRRARLGPFEYDAWPAGWGAEPTSCPRCDAVLDPQNFYKYAGEALVRLDGTRRLLGGLNSCPG